MRLRDALERWLRTRLPDVSEAYGRDLRRYVRYWLKAWGESRPVSDLSSLEVEDYQLQRAKNVAATRLNCERYVLRQFCRWARGHGLTSAQPEAGWPARRGGTKKTPRALSPEEEERLCQASPPWLSRYIRWAVATGLRAGTTRQLRWRHLEGGRLRAPAPTMKARRPLDVPLSRKAREAAGPPGNPDSPVFPDLPNPCTLYYHFKRAAHRAGLPPEVTPHCLRATFVARLEAAGAPLSLTLQLGGWSSAGVVIRHYYARAGDADALRYLERC